MRNSILVDALVEISYSFFRKHSYFPHFVAKELFCHCEGIKRRKQSHKRKIESATLPPVARALKNDLVILRKCPWGAMPVDIKAKSYLERRSEVE
jgi:hypothetical protein